MYISVNELLQYTDEERRRWELWFHSNSDELLAVPVAGDEAQTIGRLIMHIFGAELRFVEALRGEALTNHRALPASSIETIFGFGLKTRRSLQTFIGGLGADDWSRMMDFDLPERLHASVRKIVLHVLLHELRHWAQVARLLRERGFVPPGNHDLLVSGALE